MVDRLTLAALSAWASSVRLPGSFACQAQNNVYQTSRRLVKESDGRHDYSNLCYDHRYQLSTYMIIPFTSMILVLVDGIYNNEICAAAAAGE